MKNTHIHSRTHTYTYTHTHTHTQTVAVTSAYTIHKPIYSWLETQIKPLHYATIRNMK